MLSNIIKIVFAAYLVVLLFQDPHSFLVNSDIPFNFCSDIAVTALLRLHFNDTLSQPLYILSYLMIWYTKGFILDYVFFSQVTMPNLTSNIVAYVLFYKYIFPLNRLNKLFQNDLFSFIVFVGDKISQCKGLMVLAWVMNSQSISSEYELILLSFMAYWGVCLITALMRDQYAPFRDIIKSAQQGIFYNTIAYFIPYYTYRYRHILFKQLENYLDTKEFMIILMITLFVITETIVQFITFKSPKKVEDKNKQKQQ